MDFCLSGFGVTGTAPKAPCTHDSIYLGFKGVPIYIGSKCILYGYMEPSGAWAKVLDLHGVGMLRRSYRFCMA